MRKLWCRFVRWFRFRRLKGGRVTQANAGGVADQMYDAMSTSEEDQNMSKDEFRKEITGIVSPHSMRDELCDMMSDRQISRAKAFGQAHRKSRGR